MPCFHPISVPVYKIEHGQKVKHYQLVPCGKCLYCLSEQQKQWAFRIEQEVLSGKYSACYFVTFTYDNEHLPKDGSLNKDDVKKYMHDLRQNIERKTKDNPSCSYYFCGEYGSRRGRPHYHAILLFESSIDWLLIQRSWNKGIVDIRPFLPARAGYVAKYSLKQIGQKYDGKQPPFRLVSNNLGKSFLDGKSIRSLDFNPYYSYLSGYKIKLPRYYIDALTKVRKRWTVSSQFGDIKIKRYYSLTTNKDVDSLRFQSFREKEYWHNDDLRREQYGNIRLMSYDSWLVRNQQIQEFAYQRRQKLFDSIYNVN